MSEPSRLANKTVASSITINVGSSRHAAVTTSINKRLSTYSRYRRRITNTLRIQSTMVWLGRRHRHLAFAVANGVLNLRFSAATVGCCGDGWKLRRVAGEARNMTENALSISIVIFSVHLQQTEISERKLFIFHLGVMSPCECHCTCKTFTGLNVPCLWYYSFHVANCLFNLKILFNK